MHYGINFWAAVPPTSAAAKQHSYRTYLTVQQWMGNNLSPTEWGWRSENGTLVPVETDKPVAPDTLLNMVSCGCKSDGCNSMTCSCKKLGLFCTSMCSKCSGQTCNNTTPVLLDVDDDDDIVPTSENTNVEDTAPDDEVEDWCNIELNYVYMQHAPTWLQWAMFLCLATYEVWTL